MVGLAVELISRFFLGEGSEWSDSDTVMYL